MKSVVPGTASDGFVGVREGSSDALTFSKLEAYLSDLERGLYYLTLNVVYKLAEVLKVKPSELIKRVDESMQM